MTRLPPRADVINLTPHTIVIRTPAGDTIAYEPSGRLARVDVVEVLAGEFGHGVPVVVRTLGVVTIPEVAHLLGDEWGTEVRPFYMVSSMVLEAARATGHPLLPYLLAPDTGPTAIRQAGQIVAVTRLVKGGV